MKVKKNEHNFHEYVLNGGFCSVMPFKQPARMKDLLADLLANGRQSINEAHEPDPIFVPFIELHRKNLGAFI